MEEAIAKERESLASESARESWSSVHSVFYAVRPSVCLFVCLFVCLSVCLFIYPQVWSVSYPLLLRDLKNKLIKNIYIRGISISYYFLWAYDIWKAILTNKNIET